MQMDQSATAQELQDLGQAFADFSDKLDAYITNLPDPFSPDALRLRQIATHIAAEATKLGGLAIALLSAGVAEAVSGLQDQIGKAKDALGSINDVKAGLSVAAAILSVAANIATGQPLASAGSVVTLIQSLQNALGATKPNNG
jgi:hypothetical protein